MNAIDLPKLSAQALRAGLQRGEWSCVEQTEVLLAHAQRLQPLLNALTAIDEDWVMQQAREADRRLRMGERNDWLGLPITVKDNLWVAGRRVSNGSLLFRDFVAPRSAWAVQRLVDQGAVVLGSTVCSEFACKGVTSNLVHGTTLNPWDIARTPGGSSGGAAAATASGIGCLALATDAGGSVRRPGAHTGVVAMKPSSGCIPHPYGFREPVYGNSVIGLMSRCVADAVSAMAALVATDGRDSQTPYPVRFDAAKAHWSALPRARIGFSPDLGLGCPVDKDVAAAVADSVLRLEAAGHEVVHLKLKWPSGVDEGVLMALQHTGLAAIYGDQWRAGAWEADPAIASQIESGLRLDGLSVAIALEARKQIYETLCAVFEQCDLLVTPTTPVTAWPADLLGPTEINAQPVGSRAHAVFTPFFNHAYLPACSVPCGLDHRGLPIGLQVAGPMLSDERVLALASWVEHQCPINFSHPQLQFIDNADQ